MTVRRLIPVLVSLSILICGAALLGVVLWRWRSPGRENLDPRYKQFMQWADKGRRAEALQLGESLFHALRQEQPDDPALALLADRLEVARQISARLISRTSLRQPALLEQMPGLDELGLPAAPPRETAAEALLPPAQNLYWTHLRAFTAEPNDANLAPPQRTFCAQYYRWRMQDFIMEIGRQIMVTHPDSLEHVQYALVLPLLYLYGEDQRWEEMEPLLALTAPDMLDALAKFALLEIERPEAALALARCEARARGREFSAVPWATATADLCAAHHRPDLAEKLLSVMIAATQDLESAAELRWKIAESYARCGDYGMGAQLCAQILAELPNTSQYGRILVAYLGYLAREDKAGDVVAATEPVQQDPRCKPCLAQILYLRWWALRKVDRLDDAAAIGQLLIEQYSNNPATAPVLLERATDALARQEYNTCRELLTRLAESFPGTKSAERAVDILARLKNSDVK
jgi:hypothetical protein